VNAKCNTISSCKASYSFILKKPPLENEFGIVEVVRSCDHNCKLLESVSASPELPVSSPVSPDLCVSSSASSSCSSSSSSAPSSNLSNFQIRKEERRKVASIIKNEYNSSVTSYIRYLTSIGSKEIGTEAQYKNCLREFNQVDRVGDWQTELSATGTGQHSMCTGNGVKGFLQLMVTFPFFLIYCFTHISLSCIKQISYEDRIFHFDATGGIVKGLRSSTHKKILLTHIIKYKNQKIHSHIKLITFIQKK